MNCPFCGREVDPLSRSTYQRVTGWERIAGVRASGKHGGSDITLRERRQEWAHAHCIDAKKSGRVGQATLI